MYAPPIHPAPDDYWTPTRSDIETVERALRPALERALDDRRSLRVLAGPIGNSPDFENDAVGRMLDYQAGEIRHILEQYGEFAGQYAGIIDSGHRRVWCSFFPLSEVEGPDAMGTADDGYVVVEDGGFWYWRIECDPDTGICARFESNGYA